MLSVIQTCFFTIKICSISRYVSSLLSKECLVCIPYQTFRVPYKLFSPSWKAKIISARMMVCWKMGFWILPVNNADLNKSINKIRGLKCLVFSFLMFSHCIWMWGVYFLLLLTSCAHGIIITWVTLTVPTIGGKVFVSQMKPSMLN